MRLLTILLLILSLSGFSQTLRSKQSVTISPKSTWIAVGKSNYGHPYEVTISKYNDRKDGNADGSIYKTFVLASMLHNEYFSFEKIAFGNETPVVKNVHGYKLASDEIQDLNLIGDDEITYHIDLPIFNDNDSLAKNYSSINFKFNPVISSINFYDEKSLIFYGNLGIFVLKLNVLRGDKYVNEFTSLLSSDFKPDGELYVYYRYHKHVSDGLVIERMVVTHVNGNDTRVEFSGLYHYSFNLKKLTPYGK